MITDKNLKDLFGYIRANSKTAKAFIEDKNDNEIVISFNKIKDILISEQIWIKKNYIIKKKE
jgi:hypothetical protein